MKRVLENEAACPICQHPLAWDTGRDQAVLIKHGVACLASERLGARMIVAMFKQWALSWVGWPVALLVDAWAEFGVLGTS